jgi:hypothetical protein
MKAVPAEMARTAVVFQVFSRRSWAICSYGQTREWCTVATAMTSMTTVTPAAAATAATATAGTVRRRRGRVGINAPAGAWSGR